MWPWALLGIASGLVEGGTVAVLVKKGYTGLVAPHWVNFAVAIVSGAPALANIFSFAWANLAHGRARIGVLVALQAAVRGRGRPDGARAHRAPAVCC